ncbi:MAG: undecaprenyl/decaprenyl-phosphate alpha-N-acetylglucosaminyl 1-phosphate transferase [Coriobacteriales bacterium]|nr:undecaprenyl/decaprenyl-phosphate alpha-N-acetylglucosaminyl 1-phosphate transferase [Coriobacteriales bacterium]
MNLIFQYLIFGLVALFVTTLCTPVVRKIAINHEIVDKPGPRRVNKVPIPRLGGIAIYLGLIVAIVVELILEATNIFEGPFITDGTLDLKIIGAIIGFTFIAILGAIDDCISISPGLKFFGQVVAACIIAATGTLLSTVKIPLIPEVVDLGFWAYPITVIYLVAFANIMNLIDGLDGLAAGICALVALSLFILTFSLARGSAAILAIVLVGACIGFLFYNFNPASIFMGDSGSLLLGLALGTVSLIGVSKFASVTALAVPIVIAGVPVLDTLSAIIRRLKTHQPIQEADKGHIHHRLLRRGFSQRKAVLIIYGWTALLCAGGFVIWNSSGLVKYSVLLLMLIFSAIIIWYLGLFGPVLKHRGYNLEEKHIKSSTVEVKDKDLDESVLHLKDSGQDSAVDLLNDRDYAGESDD